MRVRLSLAGEATLPIAVGRDPGSAVARRVVKWIDIQGLKLQSPRHSSTTGKEIEHD
jgi:hypothetical protein